MELTDSTAARRPERRRLSSVDLEADEEHEDHQTELGGNLEVRADLEREEPGRQVAG